MLIEKLFGGLNIIKTRKSDKENNNTIVCQKIKIFLEKSLFCLNILIYLN